MTILKKALILLIKATLWVLDKDHREAFSISDHDEKKFTHIQEHDFKSDFGTVRKAFRTVPYAVWELKTVNRSLLAADKHIVINEQHESVWVQDIKVGDKIKTADGIEEVIDCYPLNIKVHMYDVEVVTEEDDDPHNHLYYTNGVLSHNTTVAAAFLLWKALFVPNFKILIVANTYKQALEIMDRVRYGYESLPDFLRAGATEYNKGTVTFDNGSQITSRATGPNSTRGLSVSMLYCDEFAFVSPRIAEDFWTSARPVLSTGGGCIITSTPKNDEDKFAEIWRKANHPFDKNGNPKPDGLGENDFFPLKITWREHPDRLINNWEEIERASIGDAKFRQEYNCVTSDTIVTIEIDGQIKDVSIEELMRLLDE